MTPAHVATIVFFCTCGLFLAATGLWLIRQKSASALTERRLRHFTERENDLQSVNPIVRDNAVGACGDEANSGPVDTLRKWFVQAAIEMSPAQFGMVALIVSSTAGLVTFLCTQNFLWFTLASACSLPLPLLVVAYKRRKRGKAFESQLPQALELMARALRTGNSFSFSLKFVAEEMGEPIAAEFGATHKEQEFGIPLEACLKHLSNRIACEDIRFFALSIIVQRETGGDLAEVLDKCAHVIRERYRIFGQVKALTAEGRLSGYVLSALPVIMFFAINVINPEYSKQLVTTQTGHHMLIFACIMQLLGMLVIKKIVSIKV